MFTVYLKLGPLNLTYPNEDLQLNAEPTLTFLCSDPAIHSFTQQQLSKALLTANAVAKRGPGCRIDVEVKCEGAITEEGSIETLKENLGLAICQTPWWSQLPICPVPQQLPQFFLDKNCPFSFSIMDTLPNFLSDDRHNACRSSQDVKIPSGIPVLKVKLITVTLKFRSLLGKTNLETREVPDDSVNIFFEGILNDHEDLPEDRLLLLNDHDHAELDPGSGEDKPGWACGSALANGSGYEDSFLLEDDEAVISPCLTRDISPFQRQESGLTHSTFLDDHSRCGSDPKVIVSETAARLLTDVAMRTLIGGRQTIPTDGIQLLRPLPRHTLAALMPLLFSPNFSLGMSQRSRFLPTITSAVTSLGMAVQSPSLKSKLAQLTSRGHHPRRPSLSGAVQAHAYKIMHTSLFSAKSARSLRVKRDAGSKGDDKDEKSMIDGSAVSPETRRSPKKAPTEDTFEMDFEDMLEDEPLSEDEIDMLLDLEIMRQGPVPSGSILLSNSEDKRHLQDAESMVDLDMKDADEMVESKDGSIIEMSEKSYITQDIEHGLPGSNLDMLL